ncbi:MAG: hypothetical protein ACRY3E_01285 [Candidatus Lariskella arthropodorum]
MRKVFCIAALLLSAAQVWAADLGHYGSTFTIAEADLLHAIESKLKSYEESGELARFNSRYSKAVAKQVIRPNRVLGVSKAVENRTRKFDPSILLDEDIVIPDEATGSFKVLYGAGTKINPLDYTPFQETLVFIDGDSAAQVRFAHETYDTKKAAKIILVNGRPGIKQHEGKEYYYYFDQFGGYSSRFGITRVPSLVYQLGLEKVLTIQEVEVK